MNMKKTMAAIAAGAVAVSAMATTVSAETIPTKTLTYNLVQTVKQTGDAQVKLTAKFYNVPLVKGKTATFNIKNLGAKDVIRISGVYIEDNKQIVPIVGTDDTENGGIYSPAVAAMITPAASTGANGTITVDILESNTANPFAFMGGPAKKTAATTASAAVATVKTTGNTVASLAAVTLDAAASSVTFDAADSSLATGDVTLTYVSATGKWTGTNVTAGATVTLKDTNGGSITPANGDTVQATVTTAATGGAAGVGVVKSGGTHSLTNVHAAKSIASGTITFTTAETAAELQSTGDLTLVKGASNWTIKGTTSTVNPTVTATDNGGDPVTFAAGDELAINIGTAAVAASAGENPVSANIVVEITKKELEKFVTRDSEGKFKTASGNEILKELKECSKELAAGAGIFGVTLSIPGDYTAASTDMTVSDHTTNAKVYQYPYKSFLTNNLYTTTKNYNLEDGLILDGHGGDVLSHIWEVKTDEDSKRINPVSVQAVINDAIAKHGEVTFTFNTATKKVKVDNRNGSSWYMDGGIGAYAIDDWAGNDQGVVDYTSFANHYYNANQAGYDPNTTYILNNWLGDNLFNGALLVNSNLTLALNDTQKFDWTATSLSFTWEAIQDSALTSNQYANYIQNMVLRTSADWYWDNFQVILGETEVEEVESGAPVEGDVEDLPEEEESEDLGGDVDEPEEEEEEEEESEPAPEVAPVVETNPGTGNAPVALAVIPVALAAAAIVAKKRG